MIRLTPVGPCLTSLATLPPLVDFPGWGKKPCGIGLWGVGGFTPERGTSLMKTGNYSRENEQKRRGMMNYE